MLDPIDDVQAEEQDTSPPWEVLSQAGWVSSLSLCYPSVERVAHSERGCVSRVCAGPFGSEHRPIVEFAIENRLKLRQREMQQARRAAPHAK